MRRMPGKADPALPWLDQGPYARRRLDDHLWLISQRLTGSLVQPQSPASSIELAARSTSGFLHPALVPPFSGAAAADAGLGGEEEVWGEEGREVAPAGGLAEWEVNFRRAWRGRSLGERRRWHLLRLLREGAVGGRNRALSGFAAASARAALEHGVEYAHRAGAEGVHEDGRSEQAAAPASGGGRPAPGSGLALPSVAGGGHSVAHGWRQLGDGAGRGAGRGLGEGGSAGGWGEWLGGIFGGTAKGGGKGPVRGSAHRRPQQGAGREGSLVPWEDDMLRGEDDGDHHHASESEGEGEREGEARGEGLSSGEQHEGGRSQGGAGEGRNRGRASDGTWLGWGGGGHGSAGPGDGQ